MTSALAHGLQSIEIFQDLDPDDTVALAAEFRILELKRGEVLIRQGDPADALYVVVSGRFSVHRQGRSDPVCEIGPGQPIGEIAFLTGGTRTANVRAMRDSLVLRLSREEFEGLTARKPSIWRSLTATLGRRLAATTAAEVLPSDPRPRTIGVIRAGSRPVPPAFIRMLTSTFEAGARTLVLESGTTALGSGVALGTPEATRAINALERQYEAILFIADAELTPWSEKVLRHADLVLAVGAFDADPGLSPLEQRAADFLAPEAVRLVLVHAHRTRPAGTARWLDRRRVVMHHHVALDDAADVERLLRFVNGTALGFVACGGGALCAAHVGLFKAMVEAGIGFDMMGGTSAGSAMAAAFVLGSSPDEIDRALHEMFVSNRAMRRYTWPRYSLLDHHHFDQQLARYIGHVDIEDLWIPFFAVSTNLSSYSLHRHRRGDLWTAVRASSSIPALLPPVYTAEGEMLVDGCLLDNVPVGVMHELKSGPNVVVSFMLPQLERFAVDYFELPSRSELMRRAINPIRRQDLPAAPGPAAVLMRSLMANRQDFQRHMRPGDLLLMPPLPQDAGFLDWHRHEELMDAAHRWAACEIARHVAARHPAMAGLERAVSSA
ncbi:MAG: patatin-like phospholipase family protein [Hyphomicrobiaceae bacterium]|nr:patatin-like phospholipase family protein [Hyphomicrobiaceae bacterium]